MKVLLVLICSIMITSMILPVSALQQSAASMIYEIELGNTQTLEWTLISDSSENMIIKMSKSGEGSQFLSFPSEFELRAKKAFMIPITVTIPTDFDDNIILKPKITATAEGVADSGASVINIAMSKTLQINIGENPVEIKAQPIITESKPDVVEEPKPTEKSEPKSQMVIGAGETKSVDSENVFTPEPVDEPTKQCGAGTIMVDGFCKIIESKDEGGCLIATAAYGTELAPQVQFLREIRDNTVLSTASGTAFMTGFNTLYYSFAPTISDMERENPMFQEAVRAFITPMISTLSIMSLADNGSEEQVLGLGLSVITLNIGMYLGAPMTAVFLLKRQIKK